MYGITRDNSAHSSGFPAIHVLSIIAICNINMSYDKYNNGNSSGIIAQPINTCNITQLSKHSTTNDITSHKHNNYHNAYIDSPNTYYIAILINHHINNID